MLFIRLWGIIPSPRFTIFNLICLFCALLLLPTTTNRISTSYLVPESASPVTLTNVPDLFIATTSGYLTSKEALLVVARRQLDMSGEVIVLPAGDAYFRSLRSMCSKWGWGSPAADRPYMARETTPPSFPPRTAYASDTYFVEEHSVRNASGTSRVTQSPLPKRVFPEQSFSSLFSQL